MGRYACPEPPFPSSGEARTTTAEVLQRGGRAIRFQRQGKGPTSRNTASARGWIRVEAGKGQGPQRQPADHQAQPCKVEAVFQGREEKTRVRNPHKLKKKNSDDDFEPRGTDLNQPVGGLCRCKPPN